MLRLGLCCTFQSAPIRFRTTTVKAISTKSRQAALRQLSDLCLQNGQALQSALEFCTAHNIGCFRVLSQILPIKTHPEHGYRLDELPAAAEILDTFQNCGKYAREQGLRTCFHPDQFVVLNSPRPEVVESSLRELDYQAEVAEWIEADVINIHGGGAYGDKPAALDRFARTLERLPARVRSRLTIENDDKTYTPADLLPLCRQAGIPLVYDVHHHRCLPDQFSIAETSQAALSTWNREPLFHISSPRDGWNGPKPERHHDYINVDDFPACWQTFLTPPSRKTDIHRSLTLEVEAKAKELAVLQLQSALELAARLTS